MTNYYVLHVQLGEHRRCDLTGEGALLLEMAMLGTENEWKLVRVEHGLHGTNIGERWMNRHVDHLDIVPGDLIAELLDQLHRLKVIEVHLPVSADQRTAL